jgi:uncharacterized iron-regulated protein
MPIAAGAIWSTREQKFVPYEDMLRRLYAADVVFLGELHDDPAHHANQLRVLTDLIADGRSPAVAMEQFDRKDQKALDSARRERPGDGRFAAERADFNFKGWNWGLYAPIVDRAFAAGLPLIAANLSRDEAGEIVRHGLGSVSAEERMALAVDRPLPGRAVGQLAAVISEGHCGLLPGQVVQGMVQAQRLRDAVMADTVLPYARRGVVVIAGRGHARRDFGAPFYIAARDPGIALVSVGMFEVDDHGRPSGEDPGEFKLEDGRPVFDFLWFAPALDRGDSCGELTAGGLLTPSHADRQP